jgi:nucleolar pre-ribosomal-associated protein 1
MRTWKYASDISNNELLSAVPVVLALLLKTISTDLQLEEDSLGIGRTLLLPQQLEIVARNLDAERHEEYIISPTLRLLREIVTAGGGSLARAVFRHRTHTFRTLSRNMGLRHLGDVAADVTKQSVRTNAVRFFLSILKFVGPGSKSELLSQNMSHLVRGIRSDPPHLIKEILQTLTEGVLMDKKVLKTARCRAFSAETLANLCSLYNYQSDDPTSKDSIEEVAHNFLSTICSTEQAGIVLRQAGYYPKGTEFKVALDDTTADGESFQHWIDWMDDTGSEIAVHNEVLSEVTQSLRPWSSAKQNELLLLIFEAAPELVARYFQQKTALGFEPKLTTTWIAYASLVFGAIKQDIPLYFGHTVGYAHIPPPTSIVLENVMPRKLAQPVLSRCLSYKNSGLVRFFGMRILTLALSKMQKALTMYDEACEARGEIWRHAKRKLVSEFSRICPSMKDVVNAYKHVPEGESLHREVGSKALKLYFDVVPQIALHSNFDISPLLCKTLGQVAENSEPTTDLALRKLELENLLAIASSASAMRWFHATEGLQLSPFVTLLRVYCESPGNVDDGAIIGTLNNICEEFEFFSPGRTRSGIDSLVETMRSIVSGTSSDVLDRVWAYLDESTRRCSTQAIKYLQRSLELRQISKEPVDSDAYISILTMALVEQLPFPLREANNETVDAFSSFFRLYLGYCEVAGESRSLLKEVLTQSISSFPSSSRPGSRLVLPKRGDLDIKFHATTHERQEPKDENVLKDRARSQQLLAEALDVPSPSHNDNSALSKWVSKSIDDVVEDGHAASLIQLLASEHMSIRKEALTNIFKLAAKVKASDYQEKEQVWLLLSELAETVRPHVDNGLIPGPVIAFASHALAVLQDPLHRLYPKVNHFLTSGPAWRLEGVPLMQEVLGERPARDGALYSELAWLLAYLLDALRTEWDVGVFRRTRLFEKVLALAGNPYVGCPLRLQILRIVYRATTLPQGSTTLVTRFGGLGWLRGQATARARSGDEDAALYHALARRVWETCDQDRIDTWSKGGVARSFEE